MSTPPPHVIIGNGIAGVTAAEILRREDPTCAITIVADDPFPAYYRPALKDFLGGRLPEEKLWARPATFYQQQRMRFVPARVTGIAPARHLIQLHTGKTVGYQTLLLANGARSRTLSCPGLDLAGVSTLRTVSDYQEILRRLEKARRVVITGSGTLALESAETLRHAGYEVTHLLRGTSLWSEVLDPVASDMVLQEERREGIEVRTEEEIARIVGKDGQVSGVVTTQGKHLSCEVVLIAIGIEPLLDFIRESGITCGRGVKVDSQMRTSAPDVFAAGDVIETTDTLTGRTRVLGQWYPAIQQAQIAAYGMLAARDVEPLANSPQDLATLYNATFLYGLDFVSIGPTTCPKVPAFQELVAPPQARNYRKVILYQGRAVGALLLGDRTLGMALKRAVDHQVNVMSIVSRLFAADFDLDAWLSQQGVPATRLSDLPFAPDEPRTTSTTVSLAERPRTPQAVPHEHDGYLVPAPHPEVSVALAETRMEKSAAGQVMTIGRQAGSSWLIDHRSVSRIHAEISSAGDAYMLRDAGSSHGTFVNGARLAPGSLYSLRSGDLVRLGDIQLRFELRPHSAQETPAKLLSPLPGGFLHLQDTEFHARASRAIPTSILNALPATPALAILASEGTPRMIPLAVGQRYTLGRDTANAIVLADTSTSRTHAELLSTPDGFSIRDLNSSYGVFVNQAKITNLFQLSHGDRIVIGNTLLYYSHPQQHLAPAGAVTRQLGPAVSPRQTEQAEVRAQHAQAAGMEHRKQTTALRTEQVHFEIDMCIGCNRCMDACPVPISNQVSIAALNQATVTRSVTPTVARFTHECVMCGSCVPVCPVDNHRDLLMLALKQRLGVSWESKPDLERVAPAIPAGWALLQLVQRLREQPFLSEPKLVPENYLLHLMASSHSLLLEPGEVLVQEGEYGRDLYLILEGRLELTTTNQEKQELPVAILRRGEYVGEDGMLTGLPYKASARARQPTLLLQIPEQVMQRLIELVPEVRQFFEQAARVRSLHTILAHLPFFEGVADADVRWLISQAQVRHYERGEQLFAEEAAGRPARETLHLLLEGFVKVARHISQGIGSGKSTERIVAYRQGGDYFVGGLDLLGDGQAATVTSINRCRVAQLPQQALKALFQRYPQVEQRFSQRMKAYLYTVEITGKRGTGSIAQEGLHALVSDGVVEGTEVLVIDLDKCIHCNECEFACERRHGHSRMNRKGMVIGNISITTTCRHCQDPVCLLCSRAGIARHPNGEVYITESCIGCGICAERCPYGAISIAQLDDDASEQGSWQRFSAWFQKNVNTEHGRKTLPMVNPSVAGGSAVAPAPLDLSAGGYDELRKKIAIKCDLCAGYNDQACVQACPAGAAFRVQPTAFFGKTEDILRRGK
ncbi:MAG TPA: FAD-dependent oxidoreductase [Ktedonobacteraceae bacterium]